MIWFQLSKSFSWHLMKLFLFYISHSTEIKKVQFLFSFLILHLSCRLEYEHRFCWCVQANLVLSISFNWDWLIVLYLFEVSIWFFLLQVVGAAEKICRHKLWTFLVLFVSKNTFSDIHVVISSRGAWLACYYLCPW